MKLIYRILADLIFIIHATLVVMVLFGWAFPQVWYIYMGTLVIVLISDLLFGYCLLSKWEFNLRKKVNPHVNYDFTWSSYYTYKLTNQQISNKTINTIALVFLVGSLLINIYLKFFN